MQNSDRAKRALALFLSESLKLPIPATEDLIEEAQRVCDQVRLYHDFSLGYFSVAQVILDYLGLGDEHEWIFKE